jgi:hypothetical protein
LLLTGCVALPGAAGALDEAALGQVVLVDQAELPRLIVDRAQWLPDSSHVLLGGWLEWPDVPLVAVAPNDLPALQNPGQAASPHFALSPDGLVLAFWRKVRLGEEDKAELALVRIDNQMLSTLGEPVDITPALHLLWLKDGPICYTTEDPQLGAVLWAADLSGGKARQVFAVKAATWQGLLPSVEPGQVICHLGGAAEASYAVNPLTGQYLPLARSARAQRCPDGSAKSLETDKDSSLVVTVSDTEGAIVDRGVRAAQWRPDGQAVLYVKDHEVVLTSANGASRRVVTTLTGTDASTFLRGCAWANDGVGVCFWGAFGATGRAWKAFLGTERVTARFRFPSEAPVKAGSRLWVVSKYKADTLGRIIEPVWSTLKAQFAVTRILRTPEGIVADAASAGQEAGVVERVGGEVVTAADDSGHIRIGVEGQMATAWTRTRTMKFRQGLRGWLEKTQYDGEPLSLNVERSLLPPIGQEE